jgi:hypothetical protein
MESRLDPACGVVEFSAANPRQGMEVRKTQRASDKLGDS